MAHEDDTAGDGEHESAAPLTTGRRHAAASPRVAGGRRTPPPAERDPSPGRGAVEESAPSRAGRNLPAAIGVGVGLAAAIVASVFLYRPSFAVIVGLAVIYGSYELSKAIGQSGVRPSLTPVVVGGVAMLAVAWARGPNGLVVALLLTVCGVIIWRIADGAQNYLRDVTASVLILLYLPALAGFAVLLVHPADGAGRVVAFVATVVCSDTGGYATGVLLGRHPMAPIVSKSKTWEGFAGSVAFCSGAGVGLMTLTFHEAWWKGLLFGVAVAVTATLGDLGESMIKRDLEIKDMGSLLPGHGGMMDRLDSLLPCAAVAYLVLSGFAPVA
ncbi:MAG: phosphatidate cytidylyltransferase [Pseudonocardiales bacterium]|nr:MAG: phosphatidate cytidylyltransferase [Pseudonocardiales bacterium]